MKATITSKTATNRNGISNFGLSVLALLGAVGILVFAAYIGTMHTTSAQNTNTTSSSNIALDQHERQSKALIAQNVANAYQEQRRGEWSAPYLPNMQASYHEQRVGEWTAGALSKNADCSAIVDAKTKARCLGVR